MESAGPERDLSTPELIHRALDEAKLLAKAEVMHAKQELKDDLAAAKASSILFGAAAVLALCALSVLFMAVALALPLQPWLATLVVGGVLLVSGGLLGMLGFQRLPKKPLQSTQKRLKEDLAIAREKFA